MRGRVIAAFLLVLSFSSSAFSECSWSPRYSGQFRTTAYDIALDGNFLWLATGYGLQLFDRSGGAPVILDSLPLPGSTRVVATNGNGIAYAGSGSQIYVVRRNGKVLEVVRSVDAGATINDIAVTTALFVATKNGLAHFNLFDVNNPLRSNVTMATSKPNVTSLAVAGTTLYAADGDPTVEVFSITVATVPQRTGSLESFSRSAAVHASPQGFVFVSDDLGQQTDLFGGTTRIARVPYGSTSFATTASGAYFIAGPDRTLRAVDFTQPTRPAELYEVLLAPTGGTANGVFAIERAGNSLYVAAGDIGLVTFDISPLAPPYPLLSYGGGATTSALLAGDKAYFTTAAAIAELNAVLEPLRSWNVSGMTLQDTRGNELLASSGPKTSLLIDGQTTWSATFRATVKKAVINGQLVTALLDDGSVWTVAPVTDATPQQVNLGGAKFVDLVRFGSSLALAEVTEAGVTNIRYFANGDLTQAPRAFSVSGAAIGGLALSASQAAVFTFSGISVVDLASGNIAVLPGSNNVLPRQLLFSGSDLLVLGDRTLLVWNASTKTLARAHALPANAISMHAAGQRAVIATTEGMISISYLAPQPGFAVEPPVNRYFSKAVASAGRLYLFGDAGVDLHSTEFGEAPRFLSGVRGAGVLDIAATADRLITLAGNGTVAAYSSAAVLLGERTIDEGKDAQPLRVFTAGDAVWVAFSKGCTTTGCEEKTLVLDPRTLAVTATLTGGVIDVSVTGARAHALFDLPGLPGEVRVYNIADPLHPSQLASAASPTSAVSIAFGAGKVHILGDKLYTYSESALVLEGERFSAVNSSSQQLRIFGDCAVITGRSAQPEVYALPAWSPATTFDVPSNVRSAALAGTALYLLTEHSIEVWTTSITVPPAKRRAAR